MKAGSVQETPVEQLEIMIQRRIPHKIKKIIDNADHPVYETVAQQRSVFSRRLLQFATTQTADPFFLFSHHGLQLEK